MQDQPLWRLSHRSHLATAAELMCNNPLTDDVDFVIASFSILSSKLRIGCAVCVPTSQHIMSHLDLCQPEVICLQEIETVDFEAYYKPELVRRGYDGHHQCKAGFGHTDGVATFYRRDKFTCLTHVAVEYQVQGVAAVEQDPVTLLVGLVVQERTRRGGTSGGRIVIANTHLPPVDCRHIKLAHLALLMASIDQLTGVAATHFDDNGAAIQTVTHDPVIVCGNFNVDPSSSLFRFIIGDVITYDTGSSHPLPCIFNGGITNQCQFAYVASQRARHHKQLTGGLTTHSICPLHEAHETQVENHSRHSSLHHRLALKLCHTYNCCTMKTRCPNKLSADGAGQTVDCVFYSETVDGCGGRRLELLAVSPLPSVNQLHKIGGLPNEFGPPAHQMTMAKFRLAVN